MASLIFLNLFVLMHSWYFILFLGGRFSLYRVDYWRVRGNWVGRLLLITYPPFFSFFLHFQIQRVRKMGWWGFHYSFTHLFLFLFFFGFWSRKVFFLFFQAEGWRNQGEDSINHLLTYFFVVFQVERVKEVAWRASINHISTYLFFFFFFSFFMLDGFFFFKFKG